jgi:hypothetical protein
MFVEKKLLAAPTGVAEDRILVAQAIFKWNGLISCLNKSGKDHNRYRHAIKSQEIHVEEENVPSEDSLESSSTNASPHNRLVK